MSNVNYIYFKSGQGVNFGSCHHLAFDKRKKSLEKRGWQVELEASTPELRAEQLRRIREQK